jgi:signal transduction histidine kinase
VALLYLAGLGLPLGGWLQAGRAEARRNEAALLERARSTAERAVQGGAERLSARLEALRVAEDRRPYYHYQNLYHDPQGASEGPSVLPSPLAQGPGDPLVEAYFQIGADGRVSLPTLNDEVPSEGAAPGHLDQQRKVREQLSLNRKELAPTPDPGAPRQARGSELELQGKIEDQQHAPKQSAHALTKDSGSLGNQMQLAADSYVQNQQATKIFLDIKSAKKPAYQVPQGYGDNVGISTEPIRWQLVALDGVRKLSGLRRANTPDGTLLQGFLLRPEALLDALHVPGARLEPARPGAPHLASAPLGATGLWISLDRGAEEALALAEAQGDWYRFLGLFSFSALVVLGAGALVVLVVERTDRLASERSRFAASAAHELRTPLAGLRMYADMLAEGLGDPAHHGDYARRISLEAERLGRVVGNVLGFTRLERNALAVKPAPGDLASFVEEATLKLLPWAEAMGLTLDLSIEATPRVNFDPDAVTQVLQNLIDNAEKYGRNAADRSVLVATRGHEGGAEFSVADRGPGVPSKLRARLFSPFARSVDPDDPPGLGLGLSLAHALVKAHGGRLTHEPTPSGGATFRAWFPAATAAEERDREDGADRADGVDEGGRGGPSALPSGPCHASRPSPSRPCVCPSSACPCVCPSPSCPRHASRPSPACPCCCPSPSRPCC